MKYEYLSQEWLEKYNDGKSLTEIAKEYAVDKTTVKATLKKYTNVSFRNKNDNDKYADEWYSLYLGGMSKKDISRKYEVSVGVVTRVLKLKEIYPEQGDRKYEYLRETFIKMYEEGYDLTDISEKTGVNRQTVLSYLNESNVQIRTYSETSRKYSLNENYFDNIDTLEKSYWLGFVFSNGFYFKTHGSDTINLSISNNKIESLLLFRQIISPNLRIDSIGNRLSIIRLHSKHLCEQLESYGFKTPKDRVFPEFLEEKYLIEFLKGYFLIRGSENSKYISFSGSESFITSLKRYLDKKLGEDVCRISKIKNKEIESWGIKIFKKEYRTRIMELLKGENI